MTVGGSIFLIAAGAIIRFALEIDVAGIDLDVVGLILIIAGVAGLLLGIAFALIGNDTRQEPPSSGY